MKQGFSAGCSLEVTLKFADYENIKPSFWAGIKEEWDTEEDGVVKREDILELIKGTQESCRKICEDMLDKDIYDVKEVKLFQEVLKRKGGK